jgi:hypothetical protein
MNHSQIRSIDRAFSVLALAGIAQILLALFVASRSQEKLVHM